MPAVNPARVFFALWPDNATHARLAGIAAGWPLPAGSRRVPAANLHLTLHFIGAAGPQQIDCLRRAARGLRARAVEFEIDRQGWFRRPRVAWLGCSRVPGLLAGLHRELGAALLPCGYRAEARDFHPHVTVARKLPAPPAQAAFESLVWRAENFALMASVSGQKGVRYDVIETYPLT